MSYLAERLSRAERLIKKIAEIVARPSYCGDKNCEFTAAIKQLEALVNRYEADDPLDDLR